jgi:hypothetical protein
MMTTEPIASVFMVQSISETAAKATLIFNYFTGRAASRVRDFREFNPF